MDRRAGGLQRPVLHSLRAGLRRSLFEVLPMIDHIPIRSESAADALFEENQRLHNELQMLKADYSDVLRERQTALHRAALVESRLAKCAEVLREAHDVLDYCLPGYVPGCAIYMGFEERRENVLKAADAILSEIEGAGK